MTMKAGEREGKGWELGRGERESEGVQTIYYSRGRGNQSGDCESAKLDPLLPRSREPFIKDVRTWTGRGLQNYLILQTIRLGYRQGDKGVKTLKFSLDVLYERRKVIGEGGRDFHLSAVPLGQCVTHA